jgi:hypothetical protein
MRVSLQSRKEDMRITINQDEIEEAIASHIMSQITINENMKIDIDLSATRGPQGFTATIDIVRRDEEDAGDASKPLDISGKISAAKAEPETKKAPAKKAPAKAKAEAEPEVEAETETEEPETDTPEEDIQSPEPQEAGEKPASIFAGLKKPTN